MRWVEVATTRGAIAKRRAPERTSPARRLVANRCDPRSYSVRTGPMGHAAIENKTPFAFAENYLSDEEGRPVLVTIIRATYEIRGKRLVLAEKQLPIAIEGELTGAHAELGGDRAESGPDVSSYRYEPEAAFTKPATDVVLIGHAVAPRGGTTEMDVGFQVGRVSRAARVIGDRVWVRGGMTKPQPFERLPLVWERAFGGWDHTAPGENPAFDQRNPVGTGFRAPNGAFQDGVRLPNIEDPRDRLTTYGQSILPVGFGFTSANWQPRASFAGTYDAAWMKERMPLLPKDFDRRFFNAAAPGLTAKGYLRGDEPVSVVGASPVGQVSFSLPGIERPRCRVELVSRRDVSVATELDTIVVDADEDRVFLTYRGHVPLRFGPHDVRSIVIFASTEAARAPMAQLG
jgi:hypothetical protein